jgi:hypothetical protein
VIRPLFTLIVSSFQMLASGARPPFELPEVPIAISPRVCLHAELE